MKGVVSQFVGFTVVAMVALGFARPAVAVETEPTTGDVAAQILNTVDRLNAGTPENDAERKLRNALERLSEAEQGFTMEQGTAGGFEPPPDDTTQPPQDDAQYNALKELMAKMTPLERVKAGVWFMVIQPKTPHADEVGRLINQQAATLSGQESADFKDYMAVRKSLSGSSYSARIDRWKEYVKQKPSSSFADLAKREIQHIESVIKDRKDERSAGRGRFLAKLGIVVVVLLLLVVIVFGAAK